VVIDLYLADEGHDFLGKDTDRIARDKFTCPCSAGPSKLLPTLTVDPE
jgi:hypothetical protein